MKLSKETDQGNYGKGGFNPKRSERRDYMLIDTGQTMEEYLEDLLWQGPYKRHFSDDVVMTMMNTGEEVTGPDAVGQVIGSVHRPVSGARLKIKNVVLAEGQAVVELAFTDGHTGEFAEMAVHGKDVRGKNVEIQYCVVYELDGQKITGLRLYFPINALWSQVEDSAAARPGLVKTSFTKAREGGIPCEAVM